MKTLSPAQATFIANLASERDASTFDAILVARLDEARIGSLPMSEVDGVLATLKSIPRKAKPATEKALPGFYVQADGQPIRVVANQAGTGTYAKRFVVDEDGAAWVYAPGVAATLAGLTPMTGQQAAAIGIQSRHCIRCCAALGGESLSARCAAIVGYGAHCAKQEGWDFPQGVKAQRELIAKHEPATAA